MNLLADLSLGSVAAILLVLGLIVFAIVLNLSFLRARKAARLNEEAAAGHSVATDAAATPAVKTANLVSRRAFFRVSLLASLGVFTASFGAGSIGFLWPKIRGFGGKFPIGSVADIKSTIQSNDGPMYVASARAWVIAYDGTGKDEKLDVNYEEWGVLLEGLMALYQRCAHLGCRVPFCQSSHWFECPCHGSKYSGVGEYKLGPAPRGMDRFKLTIEAGQVVVDTAPTSTHLGPPRGTDTTGQNPEGPFCV